jgi:broad specificity polyphosphatase/5'/3'-nucleotidase SurE
LSIRGRAASGRFGYLNVNVPDEITASPPVHFTELTYDCDIQVSAGEDRYEGYDAFYDPLRPGRDRDVTDERGADRRAVAEGAISVTPLHVRARHGDAATLAELLDGYETVGH